MWIYILSLTKDKYYVGITNKDVNERFEEHINGKGSVWTCIYKPLKIIYKYKTDDHFDEDKYTLEMMSIYGIDNVRGGSFVKEHLTDEQKYIIKMMIATGTNTCFRCGRNNHYVHECHAKTHFDGSKIIDDYSEEVINEINHNNSLDIIKKDAVDISIDQSQHKEINPIANNHNNVSDILADDIGYEEINDNGADTKATHKGLPWSEEEEKSLIKLYLNENIDIPTIASIHKRTPNAISSRLKKLNSLKEENHKN